MRILSESGYGTIHITDETDVEDVIASELERTYELIRELMSFKYDLIVLSPNEIQDEIIQTLDKMVARYKDL